MSLKDVILGTTDLGVPGYVDPALVAHQAERHRQLKEICRRHFVEIPPGELRRQPDGRLVYGGQVFVAIRAQVLDERGNLTYNGATAFTDDGPASGFSFYTRAESLADLEERKRERERVRAEHERQRREEFAALPRRPVTIGDLAGKPLPTLRAAAALVDAHGGTVIAHQGELVIELAERGIPERGRIIGACRVLFEAAPTVLAVLAERTDKPLADRLPDAHVRGGGGIG